MPRTSRKTKNRVRDRRGATTATKGDEEHIAREAQHV